MKVVILLFGVVILTILTQIGGVVLLVSWLLSLIIFRKSRFPKTIRCITFLALYSMATFIIVPQLAKLFGRVPLPISNNSNLIPASFASYFLNRHYVSRELKSALIAISDKMNIEYPGTKALYLDANFPFFNGFPLLPHLSHNDGKKVDLALYYSHQNQPLINKTPTLTGYGYFIQPKNGEINYAKICTEKGNWQYGFTGLLVFRNKNKYQLDEPKTRELLSVIVDHPSIKKVFIEPHLKTRLGFRNENKLRFQGCHAVRHDDHIHIQL